MKSLLANRTGLFLFFAFFLSVLISLQSYLQDDKLYANGNYHNRYNNYTIFRYSFEHLKQGENLYVNHDDQHFDLFKYSPTFALLMAPFYYAPDYIGLFAWNALNILVLVFALSKFHFPSEKMKLLAHLFLLPEIILSAQNSQSNILIAGLMVLSFVYLTENKISKAVLVLLLAVFIKPFALVGFILFLFFPGKLKMLGWSLLWTFVLLLLPLLVVSWSELTWQYHNWREMLQMDHSASYGISMLGWLYTWFGIEGNKFLVLLLGTLLLLLPLLLIREYRNSRYQLLMLSSVLLWVILFNHKAESSTFIIAVTGIAIWFFTQRSSVVNTVLIITAFVFTCLVATDLFPRPWRKEWAEPYVIKVFPCILVWLKILYDLFSMWLKTRASKLSGSSSR
jgi:hypothetical protein